ncbi:universal stress protein [Chitinophaga sp. 30R24]|uniref:universal stress protein n=1 Tax=Chitinophaga sp. 30R24 TaxID=3248838 RepID=UPI003B8FE09E
MKTLLIPVDFTATSDETVKFAAAWCQQYAYKRVILLKTFYNNVFSDIVVSAEYGAVHPDFMKEQREEAQQHLEMLMQQIHAVDSQLQVTFVVSESPLLRAVMELVEEASPDMILLGSDPTGDSLISRHIIGITKISPVRVMVVPAGYTYQPVKEALVPIDFKALEAVDKLNKIELSPVWEGIRLVVLNIDAEEHYKHPDEQFNMHVHYLQSYLEQFNYDIYFKNDTDVINGIIGFTRENNVQLIVALPGKHSFLYLLTHKSISEAITRVAHVPVMVLK